MKASAIAQPAPNRPTAQTSQNLPFENARRDASERAAVQSIVRESSGVEGRALVCPKCGSSDTIKKGDSIPNKKGEVGQLIKCKHCGKFSTIR